MHGAAAESGICSSGYFGPSSFSNNPESFEAECGVVNIHLIFLSITSGQSDLKETLCSVALCPCAGSLASPGPADQPAVSSVARPGLASACVSVDTDPGETGG